MKGESRDALLTTLRTDWPQVTLFGMAVDSIPLEPLADALIAWLETADAPLHVVTVNPEILEHALADPGLFAAIQSAELIVPDGMGIRLAARRLTGRNLPKVPGVELAHRLLALFRRTCEIHMRPTTQVAA